MRRDSGDLPNETFTSNSTPLHQILIHEYHQLSLHHQNNNTKDF